MISGRPLRGYYAGTQKDHSFRECGVLNRTERQIVERNKVFICVFDP